MIRIVGNIMKRKVLIIGCLLLAFLSMHAQSAWKILPEKAEVAGKKLRNTFTTWIYNEELQIEQVHIVNNRMLRLQLRCPLHTLEYRSEIGIAKRQLRNGWHEEIAVFKPEEPLFFLPDETVEIKIDLSSFNQNGEYCIIFRLHTELKETYYVRVYFNTEDFPEPKGFETMPTFGVEYEKEQEDENYVYSFIENGPEFPRGKEEMKRFIKKHIRPENVPSDLHSMHYVDVGVLVDKDGTLLYPEIIYSNHKGLNEEAMRIVSLMPKWEPGSINGKKVRCSHSIEFRPMVD